MAEEVNFMKSGLVFSLVFLTLIFSGCSNTDSSVEDQDEVFIESEELDVVTEVVEGPVSVTTDSSVEDQDEVFIESEELDVVTEMVEGPVSVDLSHLFHPPAVGTFKGPSLLAEIIAEQRQSNTIDDWHCHLETTVLSESCRLFKIALYSTYGAASVDEILGANFDPDFQQNYAISVVNTVPILVSRNLDGYAKKVFEDYSNLGTDAEALLNSGAGICGHQTFVAIALFNIAGMEARILEWWYLIDGDTDERRNHIFVEVLIGDEFKPVDTTSGAYWVNEDGSMASTENIGLDNVIYNQALMYQSSSTSNSNSYEPFEYLYAKNMSDVTQRGTGIVHYYATETVIQHIPNFVGDNIFDDYAGGTQFKIEKAGTVTVDVSGYGGSDAFICLENNCMPISSSNIGIFTFENKGNGRLYIETEGDIGYAILSSIEIN